MIVATEDPIIAVEELREDATAVVGADRIEWRVVDGAHDIPVTAPSEIVDAVCTFWGVGEA